MKQIKDILILGFIIILLTSLILTCEGSNTKNIVSAEEENNNIKKENKKGSQDSLNSNKETDLENLSENNKTKTDTEDNDNPIISNDDVRINTDNDTQNTKTTEETIKNENNNEKDKTTSNDVDETNTENSDKKNDDAEKEDSSNTTNDNNSEKTEDNFHNVIEDKELENDAVINPTTKKKETYFFENKDKWRSLNYNILEQGSHSTSINLDFFAFSREDMFEKFYKDLKALPSNDMNANPGIHFDFNLGVVLTTGERYVKGANININDVRYNGKAIYVYFNETKPEKGIRRTLNHPYTIASIYFDKEVRKNSKLVSFINQDTGSLELSAPIVETKRYPYYEIPEKLDIYPVEKGDYGNFKEEKYMAFVDHISFNSSYVDLKENTEYKVRPPELNFLGNVVVMMSYGEKSDGGYKIYANSAYSNVYIFGETLYVMVRREKPTDETIRYYDVTSPYSIASIQVGIKAEYLKKAIFIDEFTGDILTAQEIEYIKTRRRRY